MVPDRQTFSIGFLFYEHHNQIQRARALPGWIWEAISGRVQSYSCSYWAPSPGHGRTVEGYGRRRESYKLISLIYWFGYGRDYFAEWSNNSEMELDRPAEEVKEAAAYFSVRFTAVLLIISMYLIPRNQWPRDLSLFLAICKNWSLIVIRSPLNSPQVLFIMLNCYLFGINPQYISSA